ncbi:MAG: efflux RND transporter periplasmic adaptor subunit [Rhodomicrobium sp.]
MQKPVNDIQREESKGACVSRRAKRLARTVGWGAVLTAVLLAAYGFWGHAQESRAALETQEQFANLVPVVRTSVVKTVESPRQLDLPGTTRPFDSATIFARATGYISKRMVDIGSSVKKGDTLAIIAAPDLDQQLAQARAQVTQLEATIEQVHANAELAHATNQRTTKLVQQGWQTQQQGDVDRLTAKAQDAALNVAQANLTVQKAVAGRLEELTSFERVIAPFDGVITGRNVDVGDLVMADTSGGTSMFTMDRTAVLRVQVYVPQDSVFAIKDGLDAGVTVPELPGRVFKGKIARNASSLQAGTRTLLTEVDVDNPDGELRAGIYCRVHFDIPRQEPIIIVPSEAVIFNSNGLTAAVYENGVAHIRRLDLLRDDGAQVEVRAGLKPGDRVILSPPIDVRDGMRVQTAQDTAIRTASINSNGA